MAKKPKIQFEFSEFRVLRHISRVDASINYEVRQSGWISPQTPVFRYQTDIELECELMADTPVVWMIHILPADRVNDVLADYHVTDDTGSRKYRKRGANYIPVYEIPKGIGYLDTRSKSGAVRVAAHSISDMLILLGTNDTSYVSIHEHRENRRRLIVGFSLQNNNPQLE